MEARGEGRGEEQLKISSVQYPVSPQDLRAMVDPPHVAPADSHRSLLLFPVVRLDILFERHEEWDRER